MSTASTLRESDPPAAAVKEDNLTVPSTPEPDRTEFTSGGETDEEKGTTDAAVEDDGEYPGGTALTFIVVALALSMFLVSLDMVRHNWQRSMLV